MKNRMRTILPCTLLSLLIITLMGVALTYGRYTEETSSSGGSYGSDIEYIVANQIEVRNVNEFIGAIQNGYTNITVADQAEESLVITTGVTDVGVDLIINLNGHSIIRNSRDPILNVENGIRLTIIDTSEDQSGSFYNPVGSVLQISGGTLTVSGGTFESGPRKNEYVTSSGSVAGGQIRDMAPAEVFVRENGTFSSAGTASMPVILPGNTSHGINGNMYFETGIPGNTYVTDDTYLFYTRADAEVQQIAAQTSNADFYYRYTDSGTNQKVVVYGYRKVKGSADDKENYAAISMQSGNVYVRGGAYHSYFGLPDTYGIFADGGYMAVEAGEFTALEGGTCIRCNYSTLSDSEYLRIASGTFRSAWGDTVIVSGGRLAVTGGSFRKDAADAPVSDTGSAIIRINSGILDAGNDRTSALTFTLSGSGIYGVYAEGDGLQVRLSDTSFDFSDGSDNTGIYATGGTLDVTDTVFTIPSSSSYGIRAEKPRTGSSSARITINGCVFQMTGEESTGVAMQEGRITLTGTAQNPYTLFYIDHTANCYGVLAGQPAGGTGLSDGGMTDVVVESAQFFMGQAYPDEGSANTFNGAGVYANAQNSTVTINNGLFITAGNGSSGIYAERGTVTQGGAGGKLVIVTGAVYTGYVPGGQQPDGTWICFPRPGEEYVAGTELSVSASNIRASYGIYTSGGSVTLDSAYVAVYSTEACGILTAGTVTGGDVRANRLDMDIRIPDSTVLSSTAISTQNGNVTLASAEINTDGLGITAQGGSISIGESLTLVSTRGTAIYVNGGNLTFGTGTETSITCTIDQSCTWGAAGATAAYSYDGIYVHGGSLLADGETFEVTHHGVANDRQSGHASSLFIEYKIKSFAIRVEVSDSAASQVRILSASITNDSGGGISVSGSDRYTATVELGQSGNNTGLTVKTTGNALYDGYQSFGTASNWWYRLSRTGGHAVEVSGGELTVNGGTYTAAQGEGVLVRGGTVNLWGGVYLGNDSYTAADQYGNPTFSDPLAGPAASYSFKMYGGTANIYGGTFGDPDGTGSGAFIMGNAENDMADANIYGGTFQVGGQAGFSIYRYADVLFSPRGGVNGAGGDIAVSGNVTAIAVEIAQDSYGQDQAAKLVITGGDFRSTGPASGGRDGIWFSNAAATLQISGGTFTGTSRSGLYFAVMPSAGQVQLTGGTFIGTGYGNAVWCDDYRYYEGIVLGNGCSFSKNRNTWTVIGP